MKLYTLLFRLIITLFFIKDYASAQHAAVSSGGNAAGSGGSVNFTAGQLFCATFPGPDGSVVQGVQQPFEISVLTELADNPGGSLRCNLFPNPASDYLTLQVDNPADNLKACLYDIPGNLLAERDITASETRIEIASYPAAAYVLKVLRRGEAGTREQMLKSFRIIKH